MRLLFIGDIVGRAGRAIVQSKLPGLVERYNLDFVIINGENAAAGFGITEAIVQDLLDAGGDVITTGNHAWDQRDALVYCERQPAFLRPVNYPSGVPGKGANMYSARNGANVLVMNAMGRVYMDALDCPFAAVDKELDACPMGEFVDAIVLDFHAEATSEKQAMGHFLDGRVSLVVGTHTHVPTSDYRLLPGGTAYMSDAGMTGDYDSVLGMDKEEPVQRFLRKVHGGRFTPALGEPTLCGVAVDTDDRTGLAVDVEPLRIGGHLSRHIPSFWENGGN
ncbi:TIGR00282 family metallophosphoesterase [Cohaesibacter celericrescens]|jgi:metallophosphoesterase (TIGR00282 family)|uniref:TIGR00282 family metallophosphoesterase n=1 Tax=Cohaesibacter celericrescens TaxID=2067669 RepID=A0A2N5XL20_9HYPH|nr:TIGR00282 family metallophosphoesterase [Cohaesibacter celericrescens]PLW75226.1 TIGR00282 family metallophosphoesterase [Cohaesibacter celericrescens]